MPLIIEYMGSMATSSENIIKHALLKILLVKSVAYELCLSVSKYKIQYLACKSAVKAKS
jgi:hypothetical protein